MSSLSSHCSLSYHRLDLDQLDNFAVGVRNGIYDNASTFVSPPITKVMF